MKGAKRREWGRRSGKNRRLTQSKRREDGDTWRGQREEIVGRLERVWIGLMGVGQAMALSADAVTLWDLCAVCCRWLCGLTFVGGGWGGWVEMASRG